MKRIGHKVYSYKGHEVDGYMAESGLDWRISLDGVWIISLPRKRDCKAWIDQNV